MSRLACKNCWDPVDRMSEDDLCDWCRKTEAERAAHYWISLATTCVVFSTLIGLIIYSVMEAK